MIFRFILFSINYKEKKHYKKQKENDIFGWGWGGRGGWLGARGTQKSHYQGEKIVISPAKSEVRGS